jgi:tetratricopeptide (TPR) repeat protein
MLTLCLTLDNEQVELNINGLHSHTFSLYDLRLNDSELKSFVHDPRPYGAKLFHALFKEGTVARMAFDDLSKQSERTIVLVLELPELDGIAWEYAYHDNAYIVEDFAFVRALPEKERPHSNGRLSKSVERVPLLFIPANPLVDLSGEPMRELDIESEWREMTQHIVKSNAPFDLIELRPATPEALQSVMARFQNGMIAHFSGHGAATKDGAFLLFENENGSSNPLEAREFVREVKDQAWISFLSACQSAVAERTAFGNLARELVKAGVPFALGMQFNLPDLFAPNISGQFYNWLAQGHAVPEAARQARRAVKRENEFYVGMIALYAAHPDETGKMGWTGSGARTVSTFAVADVSDLPTPSGFIGRQRELMNIGTKLLTKKKPNTVTLHGAGGIGKTALMRHALVRFAPSFEAALAIALDPLPSLESVLGRLERFLKLPSPCANDTKEREEIVRGKLAGRETLLGLDNFETLNYALNNKGSDEEKTAKSLHSFFKDLAANGVTLCVTSREVTKLGGEIIEEIQGLPNESGGRLFQENVVWQKQKDQIYIEKTQQVSEMVGGHPLALRLLASAFDDNVGMSLEQFVEDLQSFLPKARNKWTEEDRQESLRASFDFTMKNLMKTDEGKELQIALSRLSIFVAFFTPIVAAPVIANIRHETKGESEEQNRNAERLARALWERGLLERAIIPLKKENFYLYRLHPTLAVFAKEDLTDIGEIQENYWKSMSNFAVNLDEQTTKSPIIAQLALYAVPDLLIAAESKDNETAAAIQFIVSKLLRQFGLYDDSLRLLKKSLDTNQSLNNLQGMSAVLHVMAMIHVTRGNLDEAMRLYQQSLEIKESLGDMKGKSAALTMMAEIYLTRGDLDAAMKLYQQSLEIWEGLGDLKGKALTLRWIAVIEVTKGNLDKALEIFRQTLDIANQLKDADGQSSSLQQMANIYVTRRDLDTAMKLYQQSLDLSDKLGMLKMKSDTLGNMGEIYMELGDFDTAMNLFQQSLKIKESIGDLKDRAITIVAIASIYVKRGELDRAMKLYHESLGIFESLGDLKDKSGTLEGMAGIYLKRGDLDVALKLYQQSLEIEESFGNLRGKALILDKMGLIYWARENHKNAITSELAALMMLVRSNIEVQAQQDMISTLFNWRQELGVEKFDALWKEEIGQPIPEWLSQPAQQKKGMTVEQFIAGAIQSAREKRPEAEGYFKESQRLAIDSNSPAELQSLGKVLQRIMIGDKNVDLSALTDELREMVEQALEG